MKNVQVNSDGLQFDNSNGTHTNVNTSASADTYLNLPSSSGTLALVSDVTAAAPVVLEAAISSPVALTGTKQTVVTLPAITTSGVYRVEIVSEGNQGSTFDRTVEACCNIVGGTTAANAITTSGRMFFIYTQSGTPYADGLAITDNDTPASWYNRAYKLDGAGTRYNPEALHQYMHMYLTSAQTLRVRANYAGGTTGAFSFSAFTIKATLISAVTL